MHNSNPDHEARIIQFEDFLAEANYSYKGHLQCHQCNDDDDPFDDFIEQECHACYGTGIEDGDIGDPHEPPCTVCGGWGTV